MTSVPDFGTYCVCTKPATNAHADVFRQARSNFSRGLYHIIYIHTFGMQAVKSLASLQICIDFHCST